jgi:hypothetical protein
MASPEADWDRLIETRVRRVNAVLFALVAGFLAGAALFVGTNWLVLKGGQVVGPHLGLLGQFFPGYRVTFLGSLIGFVYAFATGAAVAYGGARIYNWVADLRQRGSVRP